jgi:hypothetical protein
VCSLVSVVSPDSVGSLFNVVSLQAVCYSRQCAESLLCGESFLTLLRSPGNQSICVGRLVNLGSLESVGSLVWRV